MEITIGRGNGSGEQQEYVLLPFGRYTARLTNIQEVDNSFEPGKKQLKWTFSVMGGEYAETNRTLYTGTYFGTYTDRTTGKPTKSKALVLLEGMVGEPLHDGSNLTLDDLIGQPFEIALIEQPNKAGEMRNKIVTVGVPRVTTLQQRTKAAQTRANGESVLEVMQEDTELAKRWAAARNTANLTVEETKEAIEWATGKSVPFTRLNTQDKRKAVEHIENLAADADVPFDGDDADRELDEAGLISPTTKR